MEDVEPREAGRELGDRDARKPDGSEAEFEPFEAGREEVAGRGPSLTFGLYNESKS